ncbi:hypothetical protein DCAR_0832340 [Daucus carota subsp. sativus]|uniref:Uncharacterized protein n=1 Tax=Daucus carota subsp. sativus TaxID=79200 RepID=A0A175YNS9_DAUCS|nr:hypothetical protein DCAR_0832340 [Daucus carota subsp. sativus]
MGWLLSLFCPLKKLWTRLRSAHKKSKGIHILYEDVKSCPYEDVHVLWSILVESHTPALPPIVTQVQNPRSTGFCQSVV